MEKHNGHNEEMPKAQSMQAADKKHTILLWAGLICYVLYMVFDMMEMEPLWLIFAVSALVLLCIYLYKTLKHRVDTNSSWFAKWKNRNK